MKLRRRAAALLALALIGILGAHLASRDLFFHAPQPTDEAMIFEEKYETITPPLGLPPIPWPKENPYSKEKAELGRLLYFDKRLSSNQTVSCGTCHSPACSYSDCKPVARGINGHIGSRHSPTIINAAYTKIFFWDGRASSLEDQSKGPLANPQEMTAERNPHAAHAKCVKCIQAVEGYRVLFNKVFGEEEITLNNIVKAIATFERTLLSGNSPYDRYIAGNKKALTEEQIAGLKIFNAVGCANCHSGVNFSDYRFHNIGIGMKDPKPDLGRYGITHVDSDWGAFKTPILREVANSPPYMHDGSLRTLEEVIDYYNSGGISNKNLHPLLRPLNLSQANKKALHSFLMALNGEGWQEIQEPTEFPQ
jgi:cytochrome c peroxidase